MTHLALWLFIGLMIVGSHVWHAFWLVTKTRNS
jgi:hypothetical protein